jgi:glycosyltransferase involved in cell wall biosynthesis
MQPVSLATTVLNDKVNLEKFFQHMERQTLKPVEVVIVDGGSTDGSFEFLENYKSTGKLELKYYLEKGCNVARGRNLAIKSSSSNIIASTDIGCEWDSEWLEELVIPLQLDPSIDYVVGSWKVKPESLQSPWAKTEFILRSGHIFIAKPTGNATSRSIAYRKAAWEKVGGYPEDLTLAADDSVFDLLLKKHRLIAAAAPQIRCYWHRFERLQQFLKESHRNFYGDGEALIARKHFVLVGGRLGLELLGLLLALTLLFPGFPLPSLSWFALCVALASIIHRAIRFQSKARQLTRMGVNFALLRLLALDYLIKLWGLKGYVLGVLHGSKSCRSCRSRLHRSRA